MSGSGSSLFVAGIACVLGLIIIGAVVCIVKKLFIDDDRLATAGSFIIAFDKENKRYIKKRTFDKKTIVRDEFDPYANNTRLFKKEEDIVGGFFHKTLRDGRQLRLSWCFRFDRMDDVLNWTYSGVVDFSYHKGITNRLDRFFKQYPNVEDCIQHGELYPREENKVEFVPALSVALNSYLGHSGVSVHSPILIVE